jgi:uncharacterized protein (TIGR02145 family)
MKYRILSWNKLMVLVTFISVFSFSCDNDNDELHTVTDIDGNIYHTVKIGSQIWMVENLRTTRYNDGTKIPLIIDSVSWRNQSFPAFCWLYNDSASFHSAFGVLYNWYAVNTHKLCPTGWHIPTEEEWITLMDYLGGSEIAGGKLKEKGTIHWMTPNVGATNETCFTALPGSSRSYDGQFGLSNRFGFWWSTTEDNDYASAVGLSYNNGHFGSFYILKRTGFSIKCIKD